MAKGKTIGGHAVDSAGVEKFVGAQLAARDGSLDGRPLRTAVGKKGAGIFRFVSRLHVHVLAAAEEPERGSKSATPAACGPRRARRLLRSLDFSFIDAKRLEALQKLPW